MKSDHPLDVKNVQIRRIRTSDEIEQCINLQGEIWGLDHLGRISPITLQALVADHPKLGFVFGAFINEKMIAILIVLASLEPKTVYAHMLGILEQYRDIHIGSLMLKHLFGILRNIGIRRILWTYEPLEGRNANNYLNKSGARIIHYFSNYYHVTDVMSAGMPIDRFLTETMIDDDFHKNGYRKRNPELSINQAVNEIPIAFKDNFPEAEKILVKIPEDFQKLKKENMERAIHFRYETREIFSEYINNRGYYSEYLYSGTIDGKRHNYYLLQKPTKKM